MEQIDNEMVDGIVMGPLYVKKYDTVGNLSEKTYIEAYDGTLQECSMELSDLTEIDEMPELHRVYYKIK